MTRHGRRFALEAGLHRHRAAFGEAAADRVRRVLGADVGVQRQRRTLGEWVVLVHVRVVALRDPRQRIERQPVAHRRVAGDQVHPLVAEQPRSGDPRRLGRRRVRPARQRQHVTDLRVQPLRVDPAQPGALHLVVEPGVERIDVHRQPPFAPQVVPGVLVCGLDERRVQAQPSRQGVDEAARVGTGIRRRPPLVGEAARIVPARLAVGPPEHRQRPARQLFARIPLALPEVQEAAAAVLLAQPLHQFGRVAALGRAERVGVPLGAVAIVDRDKGRLAAHRQPHVAVAQALVDLAADDGDPRPLLVGIRPGDTRRLEDPRHPHGVLEGDLALVDAAADRRRRGRVRRAGHRNVPLAGQQPGSRVQSDPARTGQVHLAPRMQVGEVVLGPRRTVERLHVGLQLDQVAGDEARRQPEVAQQLHEQPAGVATRSGGQFERLLRRLHARLHADQVADLPLQPPVQRHQEVDRPLLGDVDRVDQGAQPRRQRFAGQVRRQVVTQRRLVAERVVLRRRLEEEVERVVDRHLGHQVDGDAEVVGLVGEDQPRKVVGERILLPVDEVPAGLDPQRVRQDRRAAVRRRAQPHHRRALFGATRGAAAAAAVAIHMQ